MKELHQQNTLLSRNPKQGLATLPIGIKEGNFLVQDVCKQLAKQDKTSNAKAEHGIKLNWCTLTTAKNYSPKIQIDGAINTRFNLRMMGTNIKYHKGNDNKAPPILSILFGPFQSLA